MQNQHVKHTKVAASANGNELAIVGESREESPLPSPEKIADYERIMPGAAERLFAMAEREQAHRHAAEMDELQRCAKTQENNFRLRSRGQIFALAIGICGMFLCAWLANAGYDSASIAALLTSLGTLIGAFVFGKITSAKKGE